MEVISQFPTSIIIGAGLILLSNIGVIITVCTFIFKFGMFVSETKAGIKDSKDSSVRAHKRIDRIEEIGR